RSSRQMSGYSCPRGSRHSCPAVEVWCTDGFIAPTSALGLARGLPRLTPGIPGTTGGFLTRRSAVRVCPGAGCIEGHGAADRRREPHVPGDFARIAARPNRLVANGDRHVA